MTMGNCPKELHLYNTMTKQKEKFVPKEAGKVGMYVCGVTAYDLSHIGHARASVAFDVLYRYLKHLGYEVVYVRNFTDVDDKIISKAAVLGEDPLVLSDRFCKEFLSDMSDLNCLEPTHQPKVSEHMDQIRTMIEQIISKECAYSVEGDVYFSVDNFPNYGQLSGRKLKDNRAGERIAVNSRKRNPADFALWKGAKSGEVSWDSPWGRGRPGWHIECSAMSAHYLTHTFDIHGGGMDLIFPHHENEIAQSCAACPESKVSYWLHNGFVVNVNDKEKMSKSLKNFSTIREVTNLYHPLALRHFLLGTHYTSAVNYSISEIEISSNTLFTWYQTLQNCEDALSLHRQGSQKKVRSPNGKTGLRKEFESKMNDDLDTPTLLKENLVEGFKLINRSLNLLKKEQNEQKKLSSIQSLVELEQGIKDVLDVLGLLSSSTYSEVVKQLKEKALKRANTTEDDVTILIEERAVARNNKQFSRGDKISKELSYKGIALMDDVGKPTTWRPCVPVQPEQARYQIWVKSLRLWLFTLYKLLTFRSLYLFLKHKILR